MQLSSLLEEEFDLHHCTFQIEGKSVIDSQHHVCAEY